MMLLVSARKKLEARMNMQIGSLNSNEPCVFQSHQSKDYLLKSAPSSFICGTSAEEWRTEENTSRNRELKPALTLWIGYQTLPNILD